MWLLMTTCYLLMAGAFAALALAGLQGYFQFTVFGAGHPHFALVTIILYLFTETLIMFFFIGWGVNIKDYVREQGKDPALYARVRAMKMTLFPAIMLNILLVGVVFVIGGAVDRELMPAWIHGALFLLALAHYARTIVIQHRAFRENTNIVVEMCGAGKGEKTTNEHE